MENEVKWVYYAFAKDILNKDMFACVFPGPTSARVGDRVIAVEDDGDGQRIGDIVYKDFDRENDERLNAIFSFVLGKPLKVKSYWSIHEVNWPVEEENGDGTPDQHTETVSL
jgi:hypothetical protein